MSRTLHLFGTDWCAMMVPIQVIRWYRMLCYDGTDSCATVVPIRRYCQKMKEKINKSTSQEIELNLDGSIEQTFTSLKYGFNEVKFNNVNQYNNEEAHAELKSMMERGERLSLYFTIDSYGMEAISVESRTTSRFNYQLNSKSFTWIVNYLTNKETEDFEVNPTNIKKSEIEDANQFREEMLILFINGEMGRIQFTPEFRDRTGKLSATASFPYGQIFFFMERDQELVEYLRGKNLIR